MRKPFFVLVALGIASSATAQNFDSVQIRTVPLSSGLAMLMGAGGNMAVAWGTDGTFLVDDQFAPLTPKIVAAIGKLTQNPVRFVLNTHFHGDHSGGNENFGTAGAIIVAHENVRRRMSTEQFSKLFNRSTPPSPKVALPIVTFNEQVTFHQNGEDIAVFHVNNAHTDGDAIIWFKNANVVHMGDTYFKERYPFIDVDGGGSIDGIVAAADRVLGAIDNNTKVIPGHGELSSKADLAEYRSVMAIARDRVKKLIAEGKTLEQAVTAKPLGEFDGKWGGGFIKPDIFLKLLYASYGK
ncbi:MAG TPA: MBL fold metallo-hydrolase [Gemmatimonadales bacterium]|nr:MBL fold metallo-hydrolase [Gemmatimonadales bacterium]